MYQMNKHGQGRYYSVDGSGGIRHAKGVQKTTFPPSRAKVSESNLSTRPPDLAGSAYLMASFELHAPRNSTALDSFFFFFLASQITGTSKFRKENSKYLK